MSSFTAQYKDDIQARMVGELAKVDDKTAIEGSFSRDIINANSIEFQNAYAEMDLISQAMFADTAWGEYLTARAAEYGIDRKRAQAAQVALTLTGTAGARVPKASLFDTADGSVQFRTDLAVTIGEDGKTTVSATAQAKGAAGNVAAGKVNHIPASIPGVHAVTNEAAAHDGYDEETDAALLKRYQVAVRTPATSGNVYHYYNWAMSVEGVGNCKVLPLWNGPGTVKVIIIDSNLGAASDTLIKKVADYIESVRPIGATVSVVTTTPKPVKIEAEVEGTADAEKLKADVNAYAVAHSLEMATLSAARVIDLLMNQSSVSDVGAVTLNGAARVKAQADEMLTVEEVVLHGLA